MDVRTIHLVRLLFSIPIPTEIAVTTQEIAYVVTLHQYVLIEIVPYPTFNRVFVVSMVDATKTMDSCATKLRRLAAMHQHVNIQTESKKILEFANVVPLIVGPPLAFSVMLH